jgi:hypothetical protein
MTAIEELKAASKQDGEPSMLSCESLKSTNGGDLVGESG